MNLAFKKQKFQDWFTQQWVILWGKQINPEEYSWLVGPFGELNGIGEDFIYQLAKKEGLTVSRNNSSKGLLFSINELQLKRTDLAKLSLQVIDFYENTSDYKLKFSVNWNPIFKGFGWMVNKLFSQRINQLNIPTENIATSETLTSEIITLHSINNNEVKHTIWLRKLKSTGKVIYSGIYSVCQIPSGKVCIKASFPLPKGNATVIMKPSVAKNGKLILDSSGKKFEDAGFYFLLNDSKNKCWAQFIGSFTDKLEIGNRDNFLEAKQTLTLWKLRVATFNYIIEKVM